MTSPLTKLNRALAQLRHEHHVATAEGTQPYTHAPTVLAAALPSIIRELEETQRMLMQERQWFTEPQPGWQWCWAWDPVLDKPYLWCYVGLGAWKDPSHIVVRPMEVRGRTENGWCFTCADHDVPKKGPE